MFDEIKDFIAKHKFWFIIGGIICAMFGAVLAALISLYFLIAVAVGLIVAVVSGFMKNKEIKGYEQQTTVTNGNIRPGSYPKNENQKTYDPEDDKLNDQNEVAPPISTLTPDNKELEEYKKEARERITKEYVQGLLKIVEEGKKINESENMCSSLFKENGLALRGDTDALNIIKTHFAKRELKDISQNPQVIIRGDIEVLFEVLTGIEWNKATWQAKYKLVDKFDFQARGQGNHKFSKCFFEHTILCALAIYKNRDLLRFYADKSNVLANGQKEQETPLLQFYNWDKDHKHGSVLNKPNISNLLDQNPSK